MSKLQPSRGYFPQLSSAIETVGINAFSKIAKMAIQLNMVRRCRVVMNVVVTGLRNLALG